MQLSDMVGSGFVISTHNTETDMAMSTWLSLTGYNHLLPAHAIHGKQPDMLAKPTWSPLACCRALSLTR